LADDTLKKASGGDISAFEALILQHEKFIYNIAWRIMGNAEDAKDISQEAAIKIYRNLSTCTSTEHLRAWIARVVHNTCMDELRRRKNKTALSYDAMMETEDGEIEHQIADNTEGPEAALLRKEMGGQIGQALQHLSEGHRALIILRDVNGLSYEEIAEITSTPLGTVKSRISRGRNNLKKILIKIMELDTHLLR